MARLVAMTTRNVCMLVLVVVALGCDGAGDQATPASQEPEQATTAPRPVAATFDSGRVVDGHLISDTFEIHHAWRGDSLFLSITSDLPDDATLMASVTRYYWEQGSTDTYSVDYLSEKSRIDAWENGRTVPVNDRDWRDSLQEKQRTLAQVGMGFQVGQIEDSIRARFTVPINQGDSRFGERNSNLSGSVVETGGLRVIRRNIALPKPLGGSPPPSPWVYGGDLQVGHSYVLSKGAPLMPSFDPVDPVAAVAAVVQLPPGAQVVVREVRLRDGTPWYRVEANGIDQELLGTGWVNSTALSNQDIRREDR